MRPIPSDTLSLMAQKGTNRNAPILVRAYKKEFGDRDLEAGHERPVRPAQDLSGLPLVRPARPKTREGDRQVPEGFYTVAAAADEPELGLLAVVQRGLSEPA